MAEGAFFAIYYYMLIVIVVVTYIYYRSNSRVVCYGTEVDETVAEEGVYENIVSQELLKLSVEYITFNNLLFCGQRGTVQIDHLVISPYGIFVIGMKGHRGWIFGGECAETWQQNLYEKKYKFYNSIKQNHGHLRYLCYLLKLPSNLFIPIIVFNDEASIRVCIKGYIAININHLVLVIRSYNRVILSDKQINQLVSVVMRNMVLPTYENVQKHKEYVNRRRLRSP